MCTSMKTTSIPPSSTRAAAFSPLSTCSTSHFSCSKSACATTALMALSSANRTLIPSGKLARSACRAESESADDSTTRRLCTLAVTVKHEPSPTLLTTLISPPNICASCFAIARPSPVPPYLRVIDESDCVNLSKICSSLSGSIPIPVSLTAITKWFSLTVSCEGCLSLAEIVTVPL